MTPNNCPICGSPALTEKFHGDFFVYCSHDRCFMTSPKKPHESDAIIAWNMIPDRKRADSVKEALRKAYDESSEEVRLIIRPAVIKASML